MMSSSAAQRDAHRALPPSSATACSSPPGSRPAMMSPSRWEQVIPAACMNVARPSSCAALGQPGGAQPAGVQPRQPGPAGQRPGQRVGDVAPGRVGAAGDQLLAGERRRCQQPAVVAGQHRHRPRPGAADGHDDAAGPAADVGAAHAAQVGADQPGARRPGRPARRRASAAPPWAGRPPAPGSRRSPPGL